MLSPFQYTRPAQPTRARLRLALHSRRLECIAVAVVRTNESGDPSEVTKFDRKKA
jgi:hypothetical protein